jgi:hypothetical protein
MTQELKPCPHCGAEAVLTEHEPHDHSPGLVALTGIPAKHPGSWTIECVACSCGMIYATREEVVAAWNRRALATPATLSDEPVAEVIKWRTFAGHTTWDFKVFDKTLEHGAKLYAAPPATPSNKRSYGSGMIDAMEDFAPVPPSDKQESIHEQIAKANDEFHRPLPMTSDKQDAIYQECVNENGLWMDTSKQTYDDIVAGKLSSKGVRIVYAAKGASK